MNRIHDNSKNDNDVDVAIRASNEYRNSCWKCQGTGYLITKLSSSKNKNKKKIKKKRKAFDDDKSEDDVKEQSSSSSSSSSYPSGGETRNQDSATTNGGSESNSTICTVCKGSGYRPISKKAQQLTNQPGKVLPQRGYPSGYRRLDSPDVEQAVGTFEGPLAKEYFESSGLCSKDNINNNEENKTEITTMSNTSIQEATTTSSSSSTPSPLETTISLLEKSLPPGHVVMPLGCGNWKIFQLAYGHKLTVDDFICAWVATCEMKQRGYDTTMDNKNTKNIMIGTKDNKTKTTTTKSTKTTFRHIDLGCGCGSVLMTIAWAFPSNVLIQSIGIEAQEISYQLCQRGLQWNLGQKFNNNNQDVDDNDNDDDNGKGNANDSNENRVQLYHGDFRKVIPKIFQDKDEDGKDENKTKNTARNHYIELITGTPPYFPIDRFVASQNSNQKVACRVPLRGAASDYMRGAVQVSSSSSSSSSATTTTTKSDGLLVLVETARLEGEKAILDTVKEIKENYDKALKEIEGGGEGEGEGDDVEDMDGEKEYKSNENRMYGCYLSIKRRLDVVTRRGLPPRFSCWVFERKTTRTNSSIPMAPNEKNDDDATATCTGNMTTTDGTFPIQTMTLRDENLHRTKEYVQAMESMGWIDFEQTFKYETQQI